MSREEMVRYILKYFQCYIDVKNLDELAKLLDDASKIALNELQKRGVLSLRSLGYIIEDYCKENNIGFCYENVPMVYQMEYDKIGLKWI